MAEPRQLNYANFGRSTLLSGISESATELYVQTLDAEKFPNADATYDEIFALILSFPGVEEVEIVYVTATGANQFSIERGKDGTVARSWPAGTSVVNSFTAQVFTTIVEAGPRAIPRIVTVATATFDTDKTLAYSDDGGNNWTAVAVPFGTTPQHIAYSLSQKLFVIIGGNGECWTSVDGAVWVDRSGLTPDGTTDWRGLAYSPTLDIWVAVSSTGASRAMWCVDPTTDNWTLIASADDAEQWLSTYWSPYHSKFYAGVGFDPDRIMESTTGKSWSLAPVLTNDGGPNQWAEHPVSGLLVGLGGGTTSLIRTLDGSTWAATGTGITAGVIAFAYSPTLDLWVASSSIAAWSATDGLNYSAIDNSFDGLDYLIWSTEFARFVGVPNGANGTFGFSTDGVTLTTSAGIPTGAGGVTWRTMVEGFYF